MKNDQDDGFPTRLKQAMTQAKVSRQVLSEACGVSVESVRLWLNGETFPRPDQLRKAAECLQVTVLWLRDGIHSPDASDGLNFDREKVNALPGDERERIESYIEFTLWRIGQKPAEEISRRHKKRLNVKRPSRRRKTA